MIDVLDQCLAPSPDAYFVAVGDETVLLQVRKSVYYGLNPLGTRIWQAMTAGESARVACSAIADEFAVSLEEVEADARAFLRELQDRELVVAE